MSATLRVLIVTDAFPPVCGGSGWSTFELARGLAARGHHVEVVKTDTKEKTGVFDTSVDGLHVTEFHRRATDIPFIRNIQKNERLWSALERYLVGRIRTGGFDLVHAQHVLTTVPAIGGRANCRHSVGGDGPRLLAGVLLVGSDL
jgi:glycosyltransferase involved in cell wall biosynthesis